MDVLLSLNQRLWPIATAILLGAVTVLSLIPLPEGHGQGEMLNNDKVQHFIAYGAIALPVALARPRHWALIAIGVILWSGAIELIQPSVNRETNMSDFLANSFGVGLGVLAATGLRALGRFARRGA